MVFLAVIDPVGSVPVFIAVSAAHRPEEHREMAIRAVLIATAILLSFVIVGQILLDAIGVPLHAFQMAGGIVLFLFGLSMIFGESKPETEVRRATEETAVFPLAVPSIASPGAMLAAVVLTDNSRFAIVEQVWTGTAMLAVLSISMVLLLAAGPIHRLIGSSGASIVSRVMGLILTAVAMTSVLEGIETWLGLAGD